jgi:protein O-GlcNAc transferase
MRFRLACVVALLASAALCTVLLLRSGRCDDACAEQLTLTLREAHKLRFSNGTEALRILNSTLAQHSNNAHVWWMIGLVHSLHDEPEQAKQAYERSYVLEPSGSSARVLAEFHLKREENSAAVEWYLESFKHERDAHLAAFAFSLMRGDAHWPRHDELAQLVRGNTQRELATNTSVSVPMYEAVLLSFTPRELQRIAASHSQQDQKKFFDPLPPSRNRTRDRLRIGYVSYDIREHVVGYWMRDFIRLHTMEVHCFDANADPSHYDAYHHNITAGCDFVHAIALLSGNAIAHLVRALGIDVLVDLGIWTGGNRMDAFAQHAAPIQLAAIGFAATTGARWYDYILADRVCIPSAMRDAYTEHIIFMPFVYHAWYHPHKYGTVQRMSASEAGFPPDKVILCNCVNSYRWNPHVFDVWMQILRRSSNTVFVLRPLHERARGNIMKWLDEHYADLPYSGSNARIVWLHATNDQSHIRFKSACDLHLDVHNYNGHTTSVDMLWAGVPLLTYPADDFASRAAMSFLSSLGLAELVVASWDEYIHKALQLAANRTELARLRSIVEASRTAPLYDAERFMRSYEASLEMAYAMWLNRFPLTDIHLTEHS